MRYCKENNFFFFNIGKIEKNVRVTSEKLTLSKCRKNVGNNF